MKRLHPVTRQQEIAIDIEIATIIPIRLRSQRFNYFRLVQVLCDPVKLLVAKASAISALDANIVGVLSSALVGTYDGVVAVDACGDAGPDAARVVTTFDKGFAARQSVVHALAFAFREHARPAAVAAGHGAVVVVLR